MANEPKKTCFIITPIGKPSDPIRRHIDGVVQGIKDAIGGEFDVIVAHEMFDIGSINRQVLEQIYTSDLVIANLTNLNPNVMYELAFRHSVGKPAIVIAEAGTVLPFDVKDERAFEYINDYMGLKALGKTLRACIEKIDFIDETARSPIHSMIQGFLFEQQAIKATKSYKEKEMLQAIMQKFDSLESYVRRESSVFYQPREYDLPIVPRKNSEYNATVLKQMQEPFEDWKLKMKETT